MQFGGDIGIGPEDISRLEPEIAYVTSNSDIEAIALVTDSGYQIAYAAINRVYRFRCIMWNCFRIDLNLQYGYKNCF